MRDREKTNRIDKNEFGMLKAKSSVVIDQHNSRDFPGAKLMYTK